MLQGVYEEVLFPFIEQHLTTNSVGQFKAQAPKAASYNFSYQALADPELCKDTITGVQINFPMHVKLPSVQRAVITAISLLTVPASADKELATAGVDAGVLVPVQLWKYVYGMFGYDAESLKVRCQL